VHNDNPGLGFENYRIVTQFTFDQRAEDGGELNIHTSDRPQDIYQSIRPYPNMSFGFETSARSYHSVNLVKNHNRDAILFNFWHAGNAPEVEKAIRAVTDRLPRCKTTNGDSVPESGMEAAVFAEALIAEWGLDPHLGAAAALLSLACAPPKGNTATARARFASPWRAMLGLGGESEPDPDLPTMASLTARWTRVEATWIEAILSLAVWVARAPRRMFTATSWEAARLKIMPEKDRLPGTARLLAGRIFGGRTHVTATS
jgi:hypothetical protein